MLPTSTRGLNLRIWEGAFVGIRPQTLPATSLLCNSRVFGEAVQTLRRGANTPRIKHEGGKIDGYKLEIQKILNALNAPTSPSLKESGALYGERVPQSLPTDSCDATANSASKIGKNCPPFRRPCIKWRLLTGPSFPMPQRWRV